MPDSLPHLPATWHTTQLHIRDSQPSDVAALTQLFNACSYVEPWDPTFAPVEETELAELVAQSMTSVGPEASFRLQCLCEASGKLVGYFHLHHAAPNLPQTNTAFISMFVIDPAQQGQQYGQEAADGLAQQLAALGYQAVWLEVYLKNWPALRFWIQQGFGHIIEYDGAATLAATSHATLVLEKRLLSPAQSP